MKKQPLITAVLFDWDFTLAHTMGDATHSERLTALFHSQGLHYSQEQIEHAITRYWAENQVASTHLQPAVLQTQGDIIRYYKQLLQYLGHPNNNASLVQRLYDAYAQLPIELYDDTLPVLEILSRHHLKLGIITNHSSLIRPVIKEKCGQFISDEFVTISQEANTHKPDPVLFHLAAQKLDTSPSACAYVGDNLQVDAKGSVSAGYGLGVWLNRNNKPVEAPLPPNVVVIQSLFELLDYLGIKPDSPC